MKGYQGMDQASWNQEHLLAAVHSRYLFVRSCDVGREVHYSLKEVTCLYPPQQSQRSTRQRVAGAPVPSFSDQSSEEDESNFSEAVGSSWRH